MANRFGAVSPVQSYAAKVRWIFGTLVAIILILALVLVVVSQGSKEQPATAGQEPVGGATPAAASVQSSSATIEIVAALQRIEEGSQLQPYMVTNQAVAADRVPEGAILARDLPTFVGKYVNRLVNANVPILKADLADVRPINALQIPPGYRAVTITVDARSSVEGWAKPNSRVDVLWSYTEGTKRKVATICRFTKVLSVGGMASDQQGRLKPDGGVSTVTLLVTEKDAKKIELARTIGTLSLSLVGDQEDYKMQGAPEVITIDSILGQKPREQKAEPTDGVMYTRDPKTGKQIRYVLRHGHWEVDSKF